MAISALSHRKRALPAACVTCMTLFDFFGIV